MEWILLAVILILTLAHGTSLYLKEKNFQQERQQWQSERTDLLNRVMTKTWESYSQVSQLSALQASSVFDETYAGMSDEEELKRIANGIADSNELGEILVEIPSEEMYQQELKDLGLVDG